MNITLSSPAEEIIQRLVTKGSYDDANDAINAACLLLAEEAPETEEWRNYVQEKLDEAAGGSFHPMTPQEVDAMLDRVRASAGLKK